MEEGRLYIQNGAPDLLSTSLINCIGYSVESEIRLCRTDFHDSFNDACCS